MSHQHHACKRHFRRSSVRMEAAKTDRPTTVQWNSGYFSPQAPVLTNHVQAILMSVDGALDKQTGRFMRSHVCDRLDLGIRSIFLDVSGVDGVDASGVCHLIETLDDASALGGGVVILETSDALTPYVRDI
jgi:anti-anti-sigma regulatory factor